MADAFDIVKKIGYILVILLIFSPLSFLLATTVAGDGPDNNPCYQLYPQKFDENESSYAKQTEQRLACEEEFETQQQQYDNTRFVIIAMISLVTVTILLFLGSKIHPIISYGLFFGSAFNTIRLMYLEANSLLIVLLGVVLFIFLLIFINKNLKHHTLSKKQ